MFKWLFLHLLYNWWLHSISNVNTNYKLSFYSPFFQKKNYNMKYENTFVTVSFKSKSTLEFNDEHRSTFSFPGFQMVTWSSKNCREMIKCLRGLSQWSKNVLFFIHAFNHNFYSFFLKINCSFFIGWSYLSSE